MKTSEQCNFYLFIKSYSPFTIHRSPFTIRCIKRKAKTTKLFIYSIYLKLWAVNHFFFFQWYNCFILSIAMQIRLHSLFIVVAYTIAYLSPKQKKLSKLRREKRKKEKKKNEKRAMEMNGLPHPLLVYWLTSKAK